MKFSSWMNIPVLLALLNTLMGYEILPSWILGYALALIGLHWGLKSIPSLFLIVLNFLALFLVFKEFGTIVDIEAGASWLIMLQNLKLLEQKKRYDVTKFFAIALLSAIAQALFSLSLLGSIFYFLSTFLVLLGLWQANQPQQALSFRWRDWWPILRFCSFLLPLVVVIYLIFPRLEFGFSFFKPSMGKSGFTPEIDLAQTGQISLSERPVFKVAFKGEAPPRDQLYWIGNVLRFVEGDHWLNPRPFLLEQYKKASVLRSSYEYQVFFQNLSSQYLFVLDREVKKLDVGVMWESSSSKSYRLLRTLLNKISYQVLTDERSLKVKEIKLKNYLQVPPDISPSIRNVLATLVGTTPNDSLQNLNKYFSDSDFRYTLTPPAGNTVDKFLVNKVGFCVHFATAYALLARLLKIPSRVLVGFQGGEINPLNGVYTVREKDAHAWVEIFNQKEEQWERVDPVSFVAPVRILQGLSEYQNLMLTEGAWGKIRNWKWMKEIFNYLSYVDNRWQNFVYSFNTDFQNSFADLLKIRLTTLYQLALLIPLFIFVSWVLFLWARSRQSIDPIQKSLKNLQRRLKDESLQRKETEAYLEYFTRLGLALGNFELQALGEDISIYYYSARGSSVKSTMNICARLDKIEFKRA